MDPHVTILFGIHKIVPDEEVEELIKDVKKPDVAIYRYTESGGNITFTSSGSVDLDISDRFLGDIYARTLMYLGVTLDNPLLVQTEQIKDANQKNDER